MRKKIFQLQLLPIMSGVQKVGYDEIAMLCDRFDYVLGCSGEGALTSQVRALGRDVDIVLFESLAREINPIKDLKSLYALFRFVRSTKVDVVHTHSSKTGFLGRIAAKLGGVNLVMHTVHGFAFPAAHGKFEYTLMFAMEWVAKFFTDKLIVLNESDFRLAIDLLGYKTESVHLVPNGVDVGGIRLGVSRKKSVNKIINANGRNVVLMVGRLWPQKNPQLLVDAAIRVLKEKNDSSLLFVFAGDGPLKEELESIVEMEGLSSSFVFLGWVEDVPSLLSCADLFILPSLWEGMPLAILEAFAAEVPVIASDITAHEKLINHGFDGFLFKSGDAADLAAVIKAVLKDDSLLAEVSQRAFQKVDSNHQLGKRCTVLSNIYEGVSSR